MKRNCLIASNNTRILLFKNASVTFGWILHLKHNATESISSSISAIWQAILYINHKYSLLKRIHELLYFRLNWIRIPPLVNLTVKLDPGHSNESSKIIWLWNLTNQGQSYSFRRTSTKNQKTMFENRIKVYVYYICKTVISFNLFSPLETFSTRWKHKKIPITLTKVF